MTTLVRSLLDEVFAGLDAAHVRWAVLRGSRLLDGPLHDVDLLVAADDLPAFEDVAFELGAVALPRRLHPWHRFYRLEVGHSGDRVVLDVVTTLEHARPQRLHTGLEEPCLAHRRLVGGVWVLDPTDEFWTVLLHCLLDKTTVSARRRDELVHALSALQRPSPGEQVFAELCPPDWSADRAIAAVGGADWEALARLGRLLRAEAPGRHAAQRPPANRATPGRLVRGAAAAAYPAVWRLAGLGITPHVLDTVESAGVDATLVDLRRHAGWCEVVLLVRDAQRSDLAARMRSDGFRQMRNAWVRAGAAGIESVRIVAPEDLLLPPEAWPVIWRSAGRVTGRRHLRRAAAGTAYADRLAQLRRD